MGCTGASKPTCWAMRDIGCHRPIDLTALAPGVGETLIVEGNGAGAPDIIAGIWRGER